MKLTYCILVIFISYLANAQDIRNPQPVININDTLLVKNTEKFIKAWNWNALDRKVDSAMLMNFYHRNFDWNSWNMPVNLPYQFPNGQWTLQAFGPIDPPQSDGIGNYDRSFAMLQAPAIEYSPAIKFYTNPNFDPEDFIPLGGDVDGYVFGFRQIDTIHGSIPTSGANKNCYVLNKTVITNPLLVLSQPWPDDELIGQYEGSPDMGTLDTMNGNQWYLTVNLRSLEPITAINQNQPVLKIRIPYYLYNNPTKAWITVDSIPTTGLASSDTVTIFSVRGNSDRRGFARNCTYSSTNEITITGNMLRTNAQGIPDSNITLSMFFDLENNELNKLLQTGEGKTGDNPNRISRLGLEVDYFGNINTLIRYFRFETPHARSLLRGRLDSAFADTLRSRMNLVRGMRPGFRIHRFYGIDEFWVQNWLSHRYFNKLVNGMGCSEMDQPVYSRLFEHCVDFTEFWTGQTISFTPEIAAPYYRQTNKNDTNADSKTAEVFGRKYGYLGFQYNWGQNLVAPDADHLKDTINSMYESNFIYCVPGSGWDYKEMPVNKHDYNVFDSVGFINNTRFYEEVSPLFSIEKQLYREYYKRNYYLFSDKHWWANTWLSGGDFVGKRSVPTIEYRPGGYSNRVLTGEEARLFSGVNIILGAKGLVYWCGIGGHSVSKTNNDSAYIGYGLSMFEREENELLPNNLSGEALLDDDIIGADYVDPEGDDSHFSDYLNTTGLIRYDLFGHDSTRIYVGTKSIRKEITKINKWISAVETDLTNLRLVSWYGKGFFQWRATDPKINYDILDRYIDTSGIKTRSVFRDSLGIPKYEQDYGLDSGFYDITLLRTIDDTLMTSNTVYMGLLNRRTSPMVRSMDSIAWHIDDEQSGSTWYWYKDSSMKFYSTAEFDEFVKYGGNICNVPDNDTIDLGGGRYQYTIYERFRDSTYWQNLFWKRGGVREFVLPFKYAKDPAHLEDYSLFKITELGYDNETLNSQPWRDPKYYHKIDTIIGQDGALKVRLLPGEGKLLSISVIPPPPKIFANLEYSNQRKLIAFPVDSADTYAYDSIRYHLVYHARVDDTMRVFYRRSMPVTGKTENVPQENIIWPPSVADSLCLSLYYKSDCTSETINRSCDCAYPSIVVRKDSAGVNRAFVVYTCIDNNSLVLVEAKINVDNSTASFETPKIIQRISGLNIDKWGTPMINAAADGNFYTWSDSTEGIGIGFKSTMTYCFERDDRKYVRFDQYQTALHPSLNSYSRIDQSENQCALVWQEEYMAINPPNPPMIQSEICHSRIDWNPYNRLNLMQFNIAYSMNFVAFNFDSTKSRFISTNNSNHPVVYRGLDDTLIDDRDRISWYDYRDQGIFCDQEPPAFGYQGYKPAIRYITVDTRFNQTEDISIMTAPRKITGSFINPDLTFGAFEGTVENNSEKAMILEFNSYNYCDYDNDENLEIWHVPHGYSTFLSQTSYTPDQLIGLTNARKLTGNGYLSHLAARQFQDGPEDWWKNRRVFMESDSTLNDSLKTSAQAFYKGKREKVAIPFIGFYNYYASSFVSPFYIDGELIRFDVKDMFKTDCRDCRGTIIPDTIKTDWFRVSEANNLDYFIKGFETENVEMLLERKSNRQTVRVNVPRLSDTIMIPIRNLLINGRNNEYRLLFTKLDRFNYYTENLVIMEDPFEPIFRKQGGFDNIIDLGETEYSDPNDYLSIYPNPAEDKVFVTISKPGAGSCRIELISTLGQVVHTGAANISSSTEINIQGISPGLYIVRALLPSGEVLQNSFVLSR